MLAFRTSGVAGAFCAKTGRASASTAPKARPTARRLLRSIICLPPSFSETISAATLLLQRTFGVEYDRADGHKTLDRRVWKHNSQNAHNGSHIEIKRAPPSGGEALGAPLDRDEALPRRSPVGRFLPFVAPHLTDNTRLSDSYCPRPI